MFAEDIKEATKENTNFRKVLYTGTHSQIVAMSIPVGGDIGLETHKTVDQILYFVQGECEAIIDDESRRLHTHDIIFVPAGAAHNFTNVGEEDLKLFTVYAPPQHPDGTVHATKEDAEKAEVAYE